MDQSWSQKENNHIISHMWNLDVEKRYKSRRETIEEEEWTQGARESKGEDNETCFLYKLIDILIYTNEKERNM